VSFSANFFGTSCILLSDKKVGRMHKKDNNLRRIVSPSDRSVRDMSRGGFLLLEVGFPPSFGTIGTDCDRIQILSSDPSVLLNTLIYGGIRKCLVVE